MRHRERIFSLALVILSWAFLQVQMSTASQALVLTATPTLETPITLTPGVSVKSLFKEDTCAPPCWFGLTPGESTTEDVIVIFQEHADLFGYDLDTLREEGYLPFTWSPRFWRREAALMEYRVQMVDDIVAYIDVVLNDTVSLHEMLDIFGQPTYVLIRRGFTLDLTLVYSDLQIFVSLYALTCNMNTLSTDFEVWSLTYYTPNAFEVLEQTFGKHSVSSKIWTDWLSSTEEISCRDVFLQLEEQDTIATPAPTPSETISNPSLKAHKTIS